MPATVLTASGKDVATGPTVSVRPMGLNGITSLHRLSMTGTVDGTSVTVDLNADWTHAPTAKSLPAAQFESGLTPDAVDDAKLVDGLLTGFEAIAPIEPVLTGPQDIVIATAFTAAEVNEGDDEHLPVQAPARVPAGELPIKPPGLQSLATIKGSISTTAVAQRAAVFDALLAFGFDARLERHDGPRRRRSDRHVRRGPVPRRADRRSRRVSSTAGTSANGTENGSDIESDGTPPIGDISFFDNYVPSLVPGRYTITVDHEVSGGTAVTPEDGLPVDKAQPPIEQTTFSAQQSFEVQGSRYGIAPAEVHSVSPPAQTPRDVRTAAPTDRAHQTGAALGAAIAARRHGRPAVADPGYRPVAGAAGVHAGPARDPVRRPRYRSEQEPDELPAGKLLRDVIGLDHGWYGHPGPGS